jgi:LysR family glycine cleavage system transcriptional activator
MSTLPLAALRAFEAAARHRNYSRAAAELGLTHSAVSHHLRGLEALLGVSLFRREGRAMVPTEDGQRLAVQVADAFERLQRGLDEARAAPRRAQILTISVLPALASRWLVPRLAEFNERHPELDINLRATSLLADFVRDGVDLALRYGPGRWPGLASHLLMAEEVFPVCAPFYRGGVLPAAPAGLADPAITLLRDRRQPWRDWFASIGLDLPEPVRGPIHSDPGLLIEAAAAGQGVALARAALVRQDLADGRLVRLFAGNPAARTDFAYYVVYPAGPEPPAKVRLFRDWVLRQAAADAV